jgi:hypothetical protein
MHKQCLSDTDGGALWAPFLPGQNQFYVRPFTTVRPSAQNVAPISSFCLFGPLRRPCLSPNPLPERDVSSYQAKILFHVNRLSSDAVNVFFSMTEILLSCLSFGSGLYAITSSSVWMNPFGAHSDEQEVGNNMHVVFVASTGRFIFSLAYLLIFSVNSCNHQKPLNVDRSAQFSSWSLFRGVYLAASIACLISAVVWQTNYLTVSIILVLEVDQMVEMARRCWIKCRSSTEVSRRCRTVQLTVGLLLAGFRVVLPTAAISVAATKVQGIMKLDPVSLGVMFFAIVFYTVSAAFLLRRLLSSIVRLPTAALNNGDNEACLIADADNVKSLHRQKVMLAVPGRQLVPLVSSLRPPHSTRCHFRRKARGRVDRSIATSGLQRRAYVIRLLSNGETIFKIVKATISSKSKPKGALCHSTDS